MPKDNNRQRMEAIHDVQSDIVSTINLVGKYTTGNTTQRRTTAAYDFYIKSLERIKLQCERGIQATRDGQLLAPPTVGKYTYHHRLFRDYEDILDPVDVHSLIALIAYLPVPAYPFLLKPVPTQPVPAYRRGLGCAGATISSTASARTRSSSWSRRRYCTPPPR